MLDQDYRPLAEPDVGPMRPLHPKRIKAFELACALYAEEYEADLAGANMGKKG